MGPTVSNVYRPWSSQAPSGSSAYQVNVNRTKTKKWVEAKVQSYDGDDWGADEYGDAEPEEELPASWLKPPTHPSGSREETFPSPTTPISQPTLTPLASPIVAGPSDTGVSRIEAKMVSPHIVDSAHDVRNSPNQSERAVTSLAPGSVVSEQLKPPSSVSSSDVYSRLEPNSPSSADARPDSRGREEAFALGNRPEMANQSVGDDRQTSASPKLPDLARMSAFGEDFFSTDGVGSSTTESITGLDGESASLTNLSTTKAEVIPHAFQLEEVLPSTEKTATVETPTGGHDDKDTTTRDPYHVKSLPDVASSGGENGDSAKGTEIKTLALPTTGSASPPLSEIASSALQPDSETAVIAPLRTPSPRGPSRPAPDTWESSPDAADSTPSAGTNPIERRSEADFEPSPVRRETTFSVESVKDNDMLSDEIIKSLSPTSGSAQEFNRAPSHSSQLSSVQTGRDSSYTLRDYRSYWADTEAKAKTLEASASMATIAEVPDAQSEPASQGTVIAVDKAAEPPMSPQPPSIRRRFSWEAEELSSAPTQQSLDISTAQPHGLVVESLGPGVQSQVDSKQPKDLSLDAVGVLPQLSSGSKGLEPPGQQTACEESSLPSPVGDDTTAGARTDTGPSLSEDTESEKTASGLHLAARGAEDQPVVTIQPSPSATPPSVSPVSQQAQPQTMSFREIMSLKSPSERIAKFNETRNIFSWTNSGLTGWLTHVKAQHPDVSPSGPLFGTSASRQASPGANAATSTAAGQAGSPAQQAYYQQYLGAGSPTASGSPPSRSRLGGLPLATQAPGSTFGHSGNQIGSKGKEFMHSAGKMGKGLLNKGRSKLRGTGDKDESFSDPGAEHDKAKADGRLSWGLMLGSKWRPEVAAPPGNATAAGASNSNAHATATQQRASPSMAPQIPPLAPAAPLSPLNPAAQSEDIPGWREVPAESATARPVVTPRHPVPPAQAQSSPLPRVTAGLSGLEIPESQDRVRRQSDQQSDPDLHQSQSSTAHVPGDGRAALSEREASPKRASSFIGLPPIRRSSTFGLSPKAKARRATDRFPLDDDDDDDDDDGDGAPSSLAPNADAPANSSHEQPRSLLAAAPRPQVDTDRAAHPQPTKDEKAATHIPHAEAARQTPQLQAPPTMTPKEQFPARTPIPHSQGPRSSQPWMLPAQRLPFCGQWKLEESRLSEPLNPVSRNRPGAGGCQQHVMYGFDKETGVALPDLALPRPGQDQIHQPLQHPIPNPTAPPPRQRSDVPPSSAQRWPELFAHPPDQRLASNTSNGGQPYQPPYQPFLARNDAVTTRTQDNESSIRGAGPAGEERGRRNRNSGMFKDLGQRIAGAASRERRSSVDQRTVTKDVLADEASEVSVGTGSEAPERGTRRPNFLFGRSGRSSLDAGPVQHSWAGKEQTSQEEQPPKTPPQGRKRRSFGGKLVPSSFSKSPSSNLEGVQASGRAVHPPEDLDDATPQKKRFSGMSKVSNLLSRTKHEDRPGSPEPQLAAEPLGPPLPAFKLSGRPSTVTSTASSQGRRADERPARHRRRLSMSDLISGMLGKASGSKAGVPDKPLDSRVSPISMQFQNIGDIPRQRISQSEQPERRYPHSPDQVNMPPRLEDGQGLLRTGEFRTPSSPAGEQANAQPQSPVSLQRPGMHQSFQLQLQHLPAAGHSQPQPPGIGKDHRRRVSGSDQPQGRRYLASVGRPSSVPTGQSGSQQPFGLVGQRDEMQPPGMNVDAAIRLVKPPHPSPLGLIPQELHQQGDSAPASEPRQRIDQILAQQQEESRVPPPAGASPDWPQAVSVKPQAASDREAHGSGHTDGELIRTCTVSPDSSIASDWKTTEHDEDAYTSETRRNGAIDLSDERDFIVVPQNKQRPLEEMPQHKPPANTTSPQQSRVARETMALSKEPQRVHTTQGHVKENSLSSQQDTKAELDHGFSCQMLQPAQEARLPYRDFSAHPQHIQPTQLDQPQWPQKIQQPDPEIPSQAKTPTSPRGPAPPPQSQQTQLSPKESPGARWKGLTKRMSGQLSQLGQQRTAPERLDRAETSTANKLLGAFKRNSKQGNTQEPRPAHVGATNLTMDSWHHTHRQPHQEYPGHHYLRNNEQPRQYHHSTPSNTPLHPGQVYDYQAPSTMTIAENPAQQPRASQSEPEPQHDHVPIPKGYAAVHGEGMVVPTAYHLGRHFPPANPMQVQQQPREQTPRLPEQQQQPQQQQQQPASPLDSQYCSPRQDSDSYVGIVQSPLAPSLPSPDAQSTSRRLDDVESNPGSITPQVPSGGSSSGAVLQNQASDSTQRQPEPSNHSATDTRSVSPQSQSPTPQVESALQTEPATETGEDKATARNINLGVETTKTEQHRDAGMHDSTPRLAQDYNGEGYEAPGVGRKASPDSPEEQTNSQGVSRTTTRFTAELEDTAGAHERRVRLASQEEKIWLDPQDDPNYQPQMSATSYPGQEWNPYEDPSFLED
ncbi:uncharacterized protein MAM_01173 [Metarhizium album ARSEF 1941]|uniref:Uncharacterized protein n=1 Tax=Metarhizium album (strain ARSEF 1941) TaxID=1081103 RepID=A0A0B2X4M1_METAS|nr:uncharacterized protein MAM_01173 [Metarhizium album ARSEF 1941]KHO00395.1 hypothetical protein MAM_01173 [Metarhizium album ARSEF 1941]